MQPVSSSIDAAYLERLVSRVVEAVHPLRIVLFGSQARGETHPESDIDLLVVVPNDSPLRQISKQLYREILCDGYSVDYIVASPSILERHRNNIGLIYKTILEEGQDLYVLN
jgi:predicted nucleotidyltransferase